MRNKLVLFFGVLFSLVACDPSDFGDMNVDPRQVSEAPTRTLLTYALQQLPYTVWNSPESGNTYNFYVQYLSEGPYPAASLYSTRNASWTSTYTGPLYNLQAIINFNNQDSPEADPGSNGAKANQVAVARILKAYYFWYLTDIFGDIPYFGALKGNEVLQPAFDPQQEIYYDLFKELKEAHDMIDESAAGVAGDILLGGDMAAWKKFANTARLFMAMRLIKNDRAKAEAEIASALSDGVLEEGENITYSFIGGDPNNWDPWYENYSNDNRNDYALSATLGDYMIENDDPRVFVYGENLSGEVRPLPYGIGSAREIPGAYSRVGDALRNGAAEVPIFTYAQVQFVKAEAAQRNLISGDAEQLYEDAIKASWQFWGVYDEAAYNAFISDPDIAYSADNALELIITQKWVHQYLNGFESWTDWRRTGYPELSPAVAATQTGGIPRRLGYPSNAAALNKASYDAAVARQGADNNFTRVWWDR
ncbi:SusD/RagB family nutrient-binding outer membrane lipoprotein [Pontibacter harenae]|uniref:SusD/RagB family nutrient-binding outer membrane lipoprotein n=1 Tax=Pontibacter harenae TaxID=2894083 RepID=UPI001E5201FA|nr:SusD/RagB family nutrient-binding outer membrane lipoprotein [Pontibacter harenae]MCC9165225.1 SusD/RagB family nutrient-binding outer membrane lipoprotein [Pontibacter harenae]